MIKKVILSTAICLGLFLSIQQNCFAQEKTKDELKAEREVFASRVHSVNPQAVTMFVNGLTGQGAFELSTLLYEENRSISSVKGMNLRYPMPSALCSYCLGETRIGEAFQLGNVRKMKFGDKNEG